MPYIRTIAAAVLFALAPHPVTMTAKARVHAPHCHEPGYRSNSATWFAMQKRFNT